MSGFLGWMRRWIAAVIDSRRNLPPGGCPISWAPNALAPVFYGVRDVGLADGSPARAKVYYPSLDGSPEDAPMLTDCGRFPLIIFAHGQCVGDPDNFAKWIELPAQLARAGYVVAVPQLPQIGGGTHHSEADDDLALLRDLVAWMRTGWVDRSTVAPPPATGLVGHSRGAGLAARLAVEGNLRAYASLSGHVVRQIREDITVPKLFTWGFPTGFPAEVQVAIADDAWADVGTPKHRVLSADLSHWDYLPPGRVPCDPGRGGCLLAGVVMWDLVTTFFGQYLPPPAVPGLPSRIPASLIPPPLDLTDDQRPFAGGWLSGVGRLRDSGDGCAMAISFHTSAGSGTVLLPEPEPGPPGALDIQPDLVNFGSVALGTTATRTLIIENQTGASVIVTLPVPPLGPFSWAAFSGTIENGEQRRFDLRFTPASNAIARATLGVTSTDAGSPYSIGLIGKGSGGF